MKFFCFALSLFGLLATAANGAMAQTTSSGPWACWVECPDPTAATLNLQKPRKKIRNPTKVKIPLSSVKGGPPGYLQGSVPVIAQECNAGGDSGPLAAAAMYRKVGAFGNECCAKADVTQAHCSLPGGVEYPIDYFQVAHESPANIPPVAPAAPTAK